MNMYKLFIIVISLTFFGCNNSKTSKNISNATGWDINSRDGGFQYNTNYKGQEAGPVGARLVEGWHGREGR